MIVQFPEVPSPEQRARLRTHGVILLDYVPENAFFASLVEGTGLDALKDTGVRWLGPIYPDDKFPPRLTANGAGSWARRAGGHVELQVRYFDDVPVRVSTQTLEQLGGRILRLDPAAQSYTVELPEAKVRGLAAADWVRWVEDIPPPPTPFNDGVRTSTQADLAQSTPYNLSGTGVVVGQWDAGAVDASHLDFGNRVIVAETNLSVSLHATHVAGTLAGDGSQSEAQGGTPRQWHGVAPGATIVSYTFDHPVPKHAEAINTYGIVVSQNSWGRFIDPFFSTCSLYGEYGHDAPQYDQIVTGLYGRPISVVFAAGNFRTGLSANSCNVGPYGTIGPPGTAKNAISVGAVDSEDGSINVFSSWGPLADGRLKPDLVAPGSQATGDSGITSTVPGNTYQVLQGTSMAAPAVSGTIALLVEDYRARFNGQNPLPSTLKALLMHTASDLADDHTWYHKGPDFASGYGRLQIKDSVDQLRSQGVLVGQVGHGETNTYVLSVPEGTSQVKVTLVWDDPPAAENAALSLVNDLDLVVINPAQTRLYPWTLDPANPAAAAVQTREDHLNVVEQVQLDANPSPGSWTVQVVGRSVPVNAPQKYSLAFTPATIPLPAILRIDKTVFADRLGIEANGNGSIDPGEVIFGSIILRNTDGPTATNVTVTLTTDTPGITLLQPSSNYPDLPPGALATNATPFSFRVARSSACGSKIALTQHCLANGYASLNTLELVIGQYGVTNRSTTFFASGDVPRSIPDGGSLTSVNHLSTQGAIRDTKVSLRVDHTFVGDLQLDLIHPDGTEVRLKNRSADPGENLGADNCDSTGMPTAFDDHAIIPIANGTAPFAGFYRPESPLSPLNGKSLAGDWRLRISDTSLEDVGTLLCWGLHIEYEQSGYTCTVFNSPPVASDQDVTAPQGVATPINLMAHDADNEPLTFALATSPSHGTLSGPEYTTGIASYTPEPGYTGPDSFAFTANDGTTTSALATVHLTVIEAVADLSVIGSVSPDPALLFNALTYRFTVTNLGPNIAPAVVLTDPLPANTEFVSAETDVGTWSFTGDLLMANLGDLVPGASATVRVVVRPTTLGLLTNSASVTAVELDQNPANNTAIVTTSVRLNAALAITNLASADSAFFGVSFRYDLVVTNSGPSPATGVQVTDTLPAGIVLVSATASQGGCANLDGKVVCDLGELPSGASARIALTVTPVVLGQFTNTASVSADQIDLDLADNAASSVMVVNPLADLTVVKQAVTSPAALGQDLRYLITVTNQGPNTATGVRLTDKLPDGVSFSSAETTQGTFSHDAGVLTFDLGELGNGVQVILTVVVNPAQLGTITNTSAVSANEADPNPEDNSASVVTEIGLLTDLGVVATAAPDPVLVGNSLTYTLVITNAGPNSASGLRLTNVLASTVTFVSVEPTQGTCTNLEGTIICDLGNLGDGSSALVSIVAMASQAGLITNVTMVSENPTDSGVSNVVVTNIVQAKVTADLAVAMASTPEPALVGDNLTYTMSVTNSGPYAATHVVLTDDLPLSVNLVSVQTSQGIFSTETGRVQIELGELAPGASAAITLVVGPVLAGPVTNAVSVSTDAFDPGPDNNTASVVNTVIRIADLAVSKSTAPQPALLGSVLNYTVSVTNLGPHTANGVTLVDQLSSDLSFLSAQASQGMCEQNGGTVTCHLGELVSGAAAHVTISVVPHALGTLINAAIATGAEIDPDPANNSALMEVAVGSAADVAVETLASLEPAALGHELAYLITVTNSGPSPATAVVLTDTLPQGLNFLAVESSQGTCQNVDGTITCDLAEIASGSAATIRIITLPTQLGTLTTTATVAASETDVAPANNTSILVTQVKLDADLVTTMSASPPPLLSGSPFTYSITVTNAGPNTATSVVVRDPLPTGLTFVSAEASQGICANVEGVVVCTVGDLPIGSGTTITVTVLPGVMGTLVNTVTVIADEADLQSDNNSATVNVTVNNVAGLSLSKTSTPDLAILGAPLDYALLVTNSGPHPATGVTVTDTLPSGSTFLSAQISQGSYTNESGVIRFEVGTIDAGSSVSIIVTIEPNVLGTITNTARVFANEVDLDLSNNVASSSTLVKPDADLSILMGTSPNPVLLGSNVTHTIIVTNRGPRLATGVVLIDNLPPGANLVSADSNQGAVTIDGKVLIVDVGELPAGGSGIVTIVVTPLTAGSSTNTAFVAGNEIDPNPDDNTATAIAGVKLAADLSLTTVGSPNPIVIGNQLTYQLAVTNHGPNTATGLTLTEKLPESATFISVDSSQGTCTALGDTIICDLGSLPTSSNVTVTVVVTPLQAGIITNAARIVTEELDLNPSDNEAIGSVLVHPHADLLVTQSAEPDPILVNSGLRLVITLFNRSAYAVPEVRLTDHLPADSELVSATVSQGTVAHDPGVFVWAVGEIASDTQATITVVVIPRVVGKVSNQATIAAPAADPDNPNLTSLIKVSVIESPSLFLERTGNRMVISWAKTTENFVLESTENLLSPDSWAIVRTPPVAVENKITVTVKLSETTTFYRLRKE